MNSLLTFSLLASLALVRADDQPVVNTPASVVQCLPSLLTFSGGSPPYTLSAIPAGQVGSAPLVDLGAQPGTNFTWRVNLPVNTAFTLQIRDSKGAINYSQAVTVQNGTDTSCLGSNPNNGNQPSPTTSPAPVTTGSAGPPSTGSTPPAPTTNSSTAHTNPTTTSPASSVNTTANSTVGANPTANQTRGPSVFAPTPSSNNSSSASANAANSAAAGTFLQLQDLLTGLAMAGAVLTVLA